MPCENPGENTNHSSEINKTFTETDLIDVVLHLLFYFPRKSVFQFLQQF